MTEYYESYNANVHRGVFGIAEKATNAMEHARDNVRAFIGARSSAEVIFTRNATDPQYLKAEKHEPKEIRGVCSLSGVYEIVAGVGLVASCFIPQAYCRFGCPTGALLNFVRGRGPIDRFSGRDALAAGLVAVAVALNVWYVPVMIWIKGVPS